jgi:glutathione synthase/RimK-type ligase-like ATP-grasp enzyme
MLFLTNEHDPSSPSILSYLKQEIDVTVINYLSPENIKLIPFDEFRIIFLKSQIKIRDYTNLVEYGEIMDFLKYLFGRSTVSLFGQSYVSQVSKQKILDVAKKIGFLVPEYIVVNSKTKLNEFIERKSRVICKSLESQSLFFFKDKPLERYNCFTYEIDNSDLTDIPEYFFPSFFQEFVQKDLELKIFYFKGSFFPAALIPNHRISDTDIKASAYRCVPYFLSEDLKNRISQLMNFFNWKMGSVDLLIKNDEIYFLEVNPSGQFGNISYECGYNIEEFIARELIKDYKNDRI